MDLLKNFLINLVLNGLIALLVLWLWRVLPGSWHIWSAAAAVAVSLVVTYVAPLWIAPFFHGYAPLGTGELNERLLQLSRRAGVSVRGVFVEDSSTKHTALNAALTGVGDTRRIIPTP